MMGFPYWNGYTWVESEKEEVTPKSLRASAKILEEKAVELEKPKLTAVQLKALEYADNHNIDIVYLSGMGYRKYKEVDEYVTAQFSTLAFEADYAYNAKQFYTPTIKVSGLELLTFRNSNDDTEIAVVWPV